MGSPRNHIQTSTSATVRTLPTSQHGQDVEIHQGLVRGDEWAKLALYDRFAPQVQRVLLRVLGADPELDDVIHETFLQAYASVQSVRDPSALSGWMSSVAVYTARQLIRQRQRRSWLRFWAPEDLPEPPTADVSPSDRQAVRRTYAVLGTLPVDERIAFTLRYVEGMKLSEVAEATSASLATVKRRIKRAEELFEARAKDDPVLCERLGSKGGNSSSEAS